MIWIVNAVKAERKYEIHLTFNDGFSGAFDFRKSLESDKRPVVRELLETEEINFIYKWLKNSNV